MSEKTENDLATDPLNAPLPELAEKLKKVAETVDAKGRELDAMLDEFEEFSKLRTLSYVKETQEKLVEQFWNRAQSRLENPSAQTKTKMTVLLMAFFFSAQNILNTTPKKLDILVDTWFNNDDQGAAMVIDFLNGKKV